MIERPSDIVVALSGGMDSSLAAALLKIAGRHVHGLHFILPAPAPTAEARIEAVQKISHHLKIPLFVMDLKKIFTRQIIDPFIDTYLQGLTPNPCVKCNELIKFEYLLQYAVSNNIQSIATGHYACLKKRDDSSIVDLLRGKDNKKEQSYFLHRLGQDFLSRAVFPLGEITKDEARRRAREMNLPTHSIPESQEICFVPDDNYRLFVEDKRGAGVNRQGNIVNSRGEIQGEHTGVYKYTIGQRHGLGIASSRPFYVKEIRPGSNEVVAGRKEELFSRHVKAVDFNWVEGSCCPQKERAAQAQLRYRHRPASGRMRAISSGKINFTFDEPQLAVTPGQALVCYDGERVIGGGWIRKE